MRTTRRIGEGKEFVGGSVYQADLDAHNYHRWHNPVSGTIRKAFVREGTYYSEAESEAKDPDGMKESQGYPAHVATRANLLVEADDPTIGLVCLMAVGLVEVSSCVILPEIRQGHRVKKGDEVGYFQYGGSTYCLIFRPGAVAGFAPEALPQTDNPDPPLVLLGTMLHGCLTPIPRRPGIARDRVPCDSSRRRRRPPGCRTRRPVRLRRRHPGRCR